MPEIVMGAQSAKCPTQVARNHVYDWIMIVLLAVIELLLNVIDPYNRFVGKGMMEDLMFPFKENTIPVWSVPIYAVFFPILVFLAYYVKKRDAHDFHHATLGIIASAVITGVLTDAIKDAVGRPRPNFFWRCFPDGKAVFDPVTTGVICHGDKAIIKEGYKSFPSGHTSWSFTGLTFLTLYLSGKFEVFNRRGHVVKVCVVFFPLLLATLVGISRLDDYWHHWTDVFAGALLGTVVAVLCYRHFFQWPHKEFCWATHAYIQMMIEKNDRCPAHAESDYNRQNLEAMEAGGTH